MTRKPSKLLTTVLKFVVSISLVYFILTLVDVSQVEKTLKDADLSWLLLALFLFICSKILNAFRLNLYFHQISAPLTQWSNLKLYLLGMFYNLFLPGGIGGDAYKGYLIKKAFGIRTKKIVGVLLVDRLSGMLLIGIYACTLALSLDTPMFKEVRWLFLLAIPMAILLFWWVNKRLFPYALPVFWPSIGYSALLQAVQLGAAFCILIALGVTDDQLSYLFVFLVSSVVSVVPLTIGGVGTREITFYYGAQWLGLESDTAIAVSFLFFLLTAIVSLFGIIFHFKKPGLTSRENL